MTGKSHGGKGSRPRKYNLSAFDENFKRIFGDAVKKGIQPEDYQPEHTDGASQRQAAEAGSCHSS